MLTNKILKHVSHNEIKNVSYTAIYLGGSFKLQQMKIIFIRSEVC